MQNMPEGGSMTIKAKPILKNKFWIIESNGERIGTLSKQEDNTALKNEFEKVYSKLLNNESSIIKEINAAQGSKVNLGGYYNTNDIITEQIMRPSKSFNEIIDNI